MMYSDDDMLMLSGIQHFRFCPRQWALITLLKNRLESIIEKSLDSIRFYFLRRNDQRRMNTLGKVTSYNVNDTIII